MTLKYLWIDIYFEKKIGNNVSIYNSDAYAVTKTVTNF